jgi:hypothetical protein
VLHSSNDLGRPAPVRRSCPWREGLAGFAACQVIGVILVAWQADALWTWAFDGPLLAPAVRIPLLAVAGLAAQLGLVAVAGSVGRCIIRWVPVRA